VPGSPALGPRRVGRRKRQAQATKGVPMPDNWQGGKDNFTVDRQVGDKVLQVHPETALSVQASLRFLARSVRYLAGPEPARTARRRPRRRSGRRSRGRSRGQWRAGRARCDMRELREPSSADEVAAFETDVLAGFAPAPAGTRAPGRDRRTRVYRLEMVRMRSVNARRVTAAPGASRSKPCGAPGCTCSSMGTPLEASFAA
jgi:hypothetical protein